MLLCFSYNALLSYQWYLSEQILRYFQKLVNTLLSPCQFLSSGFFLFHFFFYSFWCLSSSSLEFYPTKSMVSNFLHNKVDVWYFPQHFFLIQPANTLLDIYLHVLFQPVLLLHIFLDCFSYFSIKYTHFRNYPYSIGFI